MKDKNGNELDTLKFNRAQASVVIEPEAPGQKIKLTEEQIQESVIQELTWQVAEQIMKNVKIRRFKVEGDKELYIADVIFSENPAVELLGKTKVPEEKEIKLPKLKKLDQ